MGTPRPGPKGGVLCILAQPLVSLVAVAAPARPTWALSRGTVTAPELGRNHEDQLGSRTHLEVVAVGPVGPIIQTIVGSDFFCQQLRGDEK